MVFPRVCVLASDVLPIKAGKSASHWLVKGFWTPDRCLHQLFGPLVVSWCVFSVMSGRLFGEVGTYLEQCQGSASAFRSFENGSFYVLSTPLSPYYLVYTCNYLPLFSPVFGVVQTIKSTKSLRVANSVL